MSWDAAIFGTLTMPSAHWKKWLKAPVDSAQIPDAAKYLSMRELSGQTVQKTLTEVARFEDDEGLAFVELVRAPDEGRLSVRSFFSKDEYLEHSVALAAIWVAAGKEAVGELYFAGMLTAGFCYRLSVGARGVRLAERPMRDTKKHAEYREILARVEARIEELDL